MPVHDDKNAYEINMDNFYNPTSFLKFV